jgi:hypothetical protein
VDLVLPSVWVIVLNWNGTEDTLACLRSVERLDYPAFSVLVVDNGSRPETLGRVRAGLGTATLLENGSNLGFALGNNRGIEWAVDRGAEYVFLLNNDTVVDPGCLATLVEIAESDPSVGIVGAVNFYLSRPDVIWYSGGIVDWRSGTLWDPTSEKTLAELNGIPSVREVDDVAGSSLLIRASVIREIGLMDPRYFMYYEETDWCLRAKRRGYRVVACLDGRIWHKVSGSAGPAARYFMVRNRGLFMLKNCSRRHLPGFLWRHFRSCLGEARQAFRSGRRAEGMATLIALRDFALARFDKGSIDRIWDVMAVAEQPHQKG